jgi:hypothetical protein
MTTFGFKERILDFAYAYSITIDERVSLMNSLNIPVDAFRHKLGTRDAGIRVRLAQYFS